VAAVAARVPSQVVLVLGLGRPEPLLGLISVTTVFSGKAEKLDLTELAPVVWTAPRGI